MNPLAHRSPARMPSMLTLLAMLGTTPLLATLPSASAAQDYAALDPGDQVRVRREHGGWNASGWSLHRTATLDLVSIDGTHLVGTLRGLPVTIPLSSISSLKRRVGTKPTSAPAMVVGSGAGFAPGFLAGAIQAVGDPTKSGSQIVDGGLTTGALLGAQLGALVAYVRSRSRGIYEDVGFGGVRAHLSPARSDGWSLGLRIDSR